MLWIYWPGRLNLFHRKQPNILLRDLPQLLLLLLPPVTTPPQQLGLELLPHLVLPNLVYLSLEIGRVSKDRVISLNQVIHWAAKPSSLLGLIDPFQEDSSKTLDLVNSKVVYLLTC